MPNSFLRRDSRANRPAPTLLRTRAEKPVWNPDPCTECGKSMKDCHPYDDYMLTREVWLKLHPEGGKGLLCFSCLNVRAQQYEHVWTPADFKPALCYLNRMIQPQDVTARLFARATKPTFLAAFAEGQVRRIIKLDVPVLPAFLAHLPAAVNSGPPGAE